MDNLFRSQFSYLEVKTTKLNEILQNNRIIYENTNQNSAVSCPVGAVVGQLEQHRIDNIQAEDEKEVSVKVDQVTTIGNWGIT